MHNQKLIFLFLNQKICCGYSTKHSPFEHQKHILKLMGKKIFTILRSKSLPNWTNPIVRPRCEAAPILTLNATVTTKVVCFSHLLKCLRSLYGKLWTQIRRAVCSGFTLFASILRFVNNVRQLFATDDILRCIFSWRFKG